MILKVRQFNNSKSKPLLNNLHEILYKLWQICILFEISFTYLKHFMNLYNYFEIAEEDFLTIRVDGRTTFLTFLGAFPSILSISICVPIKPKS